MAESSELISGLCIVNNGSQFHKYEFNNTQEESLNHVSLDLGDTSDISKFNVISNYPTIQKECQRKDFLDNPIEKICTKVGRQSKRNRWSCKQMTLTETSSISLPEEENKTYDINDNSFKKVKAKAKKWTKSNGSSLNSSRVESDVGKILKTEENNEDTSCVTSVITQDGNVAGQYNGTLNAGLSVASVSQPSDECMDDTQPPELEGEDLAVRARSLPHVMGVCYKPTARCWTAYWTNQTTSKRNMRHFFIGKKYDFDEARALAIKCRRDAETQFQKLGKHKHNSKATADSMYERARRALPVRGVSFHRLNQRWVANWQDGSKYIRQSFPVRKFGFFRARHLAVQSRRAAELRLCIGSNTSPLKKRKTAKNSDKEVQDGMGGYSACVNTYDWHSKESLNEQISSILQESAFSQACKQFIALQQTCGSASKNVFVNNPANLGMSLGYPKIEHFKTALINKQKHLSSNSNDVNKKLYLKKYHAIGPIHMSTIPIDKKRSGQINCNCQCIATANIYHAKISSSVQFCSHPNFPNTKYEAKVRSKLCKKRMRCLSELARCMPSVANLHFSKSKACWVCFHRGNDKTLQKAVFSWARYGFELSRKCAIEWLLKRCNREVTMCANGLTSSVAGKSDIPVFREQSKKCKHNKYYDESKFSARTTSFGSDTSTATEFHGMNLSTASNYESQKHFYLAKQVVRYILEDLQACLSSTLLYCDGSEIFSTLQKHIYFTNWSKRLNQLVPYFEVLKNCVKICILPSMMSVCEQTDLLYRVCFGIKLPLKQPKSVV